MRRTTSLLAAAALLAGAAAAASSTHDPARHAGTAPVHLVPGDRLSGLGATSAPPTTASCLARSGGRVSCYQPAQLRVAYNLAPLYARGLDGRHETIVIVDAFGSPTIASDLATFDNTFRIPAPPSFKVIHPVGNIPAYSPNGPDRVGWAGETSLDVEWAHAMAPGASILLVETPTDEVEGTTGFPDIVKAEKYVVAHHLGTVISQSFGATERTFTGYAQLAPLRAAYPAAAAAGVSVVSGSGDLGATDFEYNARNIYPFRVTSWPATDPLVTAVGGTRLLLNTNGAAISPAVVWNDVFPSLTTQPDASGGGTSEYFSRPSWQSSVAATVGTARGVPDISLSASCLGVVDVYMSFPGSSHGWQSMCGTSEATPLFAGVVAIADQQAGHGLGVLNAALYAMAAAHAPGIVDVTSGDNTARWEVAGKAQSVVGYSAAVGYDLASGLGTINAGLFVPELVAEVHHLTGR